MERENTNPSILNAISSRSGKAIRKHLVVATVIIALIVSMIVTGCASSSSEKLEWPTSGLAAVLPEPPTDKGKISTNSDDSFYASLDQCSSGDFNNYVEACKEKGFSVEASNSTNGFEAYTEDGHHLNLSYSESSEKITISLDAPLEMKTISWPTSGPASLLPAPPSLKASVGNDSTNMFSAYIGDVSPEAFDEYITACSNAGFNIDYNKTDTTYDADNAAGASVRLEYRGNNTMFVRADAPKEEATNSTAPATGEESATPAATESPEPTTTTNGVTPEFKATMDEYEAFFDEYIAFMKTYQESDNALAMAADYASMMSRYADMMKKLEEVDESSLSTADAAYYAEVSARITQKLAEAA